MGNILLEKVDRVAEVSVPTVDNEMAFHASHPNMHIEAKKVAHTLTESNVSDPVETTTRSFEGFGIQ